MLNYDWTAGVIRCRATDPEGYPCILAPSHTSDHRWARCEMTDEQGYRCILPPHHPGVVYEGSRPAGDLRGPSGIPGPR